MGANQQLMMATGNAIQYTKLNSADKNANITLSNNDLTAAHSGAGAGRAVKSVAAGEDKYWEITINTATNCDVAVATGANSNAAAPGNSASSIGWLPTGEIIQSGGTLSSGHTYTGADVLSIRVNRTANQVEFRKNNTLVYTATGLGADTYPCTGATGSGANVTFNFGPTMTYSIPSGSSLITA